MKLLLTLIAPITLLANGGGYHHGVKFTGTPAPFQPTGTEHVQILDEKLHITLNEKSAHVRIQYKMRNTRRIPTKVTFGFPVEVIDVGHGVFENKTEAPRNRFAKYCTNYSIQDDLKPVNATYKDEPFGKKDTPEFPGADVLEDIQGWMVSSLKFAGLETRTVTIRYDSEYDLIFRGISDSVFHGAPTFRYRLSTGSVWAGPIQAGQITITPSASIDPAPVTIIAPVNRFTRSQDHTFTWSFENLEPTLADDITLQLKPAVNYHYDYAFEDEVQNRPEFAYFVETESRWQRLHTGYDVTASSTLAPQENFTYDVTNLKDREWSDNAPTAWVEGVEGQGINEHLDLTVKKPLPLDALKIRPDFGKSPAHFTANSRPAKLEITLNNSHTFTATLADKNATQTIPITNYTTPVKTIRLTIKEVYTGTQFADTAIAHVHLLARLPAEPKRYGAR